MPVEMNRVNRTCPQCGNSRLFNVDGISFFCGQCLGEMNVDMSIRNEKSIPEEISKIILEQPETVQQVTIIEKKADVNMADLISSITEPQT